MSTQNGDRADEKPQNNVLTLNDTVSEDLSAQKSDRIAANKKRLADLISGIERDYWAIGDLLIELHRDEVTLADLTYLGWSQGRLSQLRMTAEQYPPHERMLNVPFYTHEIARAASKTIAKEVQEKLNQSPSPEIAAAILPFAKQNPLATLQQILAAEAIPKTTAKGLTKLKKLKSRDATRMVGNLVKNAIAAVTPPPAPEQPHPILDRAFHLTNETLLNQWLESDVKLEFKLISLDPPYGTYDKHKDGHLDQGTSAAEFVGADNIDRESALRTTCETIRLLPPFLAVGGTILLWQSCDCLRSEILAAIEDSGFEVEVCLVWIKKVPQPQDFVTAWTRQCEFCYVLKHKGEKLLNHDDALKRSNVLTHWFDGPAAQIEGCHWWRKPSSLMEFLVEKCTHPNENVLDLFACTGSLSKAAAKLNRRFVYCESFADNYAENAPKVLAALELAQAGTHEPVAA